MMENTAQRFARQGIDIRQLDLDVARIRADLREQALHTVKAALVLEAIAEVEKLEVTAEDEKAELERRAVELGVPLQKLKVRDEMRAALRQQIREDKTVALLAEHANYK
jgi:trigger factor